MKARLLSDRGALSLDGRALLYWIRRSESERRRAHPLAIPRAAMARLLAAGEGPLHPLIEKYRDELFEECRLHGS